MAVVNVRCFQFSWLHFIGLLTCFCAYALKKVIELNWIE